MLITIHADKAHLDQASRLSAERRLSFALGRFAHRIRTVRLVVADQNGPRGGPDKLCRVDVRGAGWSVHVEDIDSVADAVVNRVADRVGRTVARKIGRLRDRGG